MIQGGVPIVHPGDTVGRVDYEAELAVIVSDRAWQVPRANAFEYIFGYTVLNDVTARDLQATFGSRGHPWFLAKSYATFCPIGPQVVMQADLNPSDLAVECHVNGELRQQGRTSQMIHDIPALIEFISARLPLLPGDIIATGTPAGIGPIVPGDEVVAHVEEIGDLINPVIAAGEH
jgi:2-keto-4-pentenoate hydratase/2-oxohepta-3-ene-1,7-dioic acid hydratase in catechol pathway